MYLKAQQGEGQHQRLHSSHQALHHQPQILPADRISEEANNKWELNELVGYDAPLISI
jgi:hypothetical protein